MAVMNKEGGFECEFVEKPPKAFQSECPVCLLVLREPYQATCCGYSFCRVCIERIKARNISCPCCKAEEFDHYPNKGLKRSLNEFKVQCSNYQQGCQWEGELGQLDNHLNYNPTEDKQLKGCQFLEIKCVHCPDLILRSDIQTHQSDQCPMRPYSCQYCEDFNSSYEDVTTNHWPVCGYYPLPCPNKCGESIQKQNFESHITNDCPLTVIDCDFQHVGCEERLPRKYMPIHLQEGVVCHLSLQAANNKNFVARLDEENKKMQQMINRLETENKELRQQVGQLTRDLQMQRVYTPTCPVELTITNFKKKYEDKQEWKSSPFYTHQNGYKLYLVMYTGGKRSGKGSHISVYLNLAKGEFDDELNWPFQGKLEIQLLNQDERCYTLTIDFDDPYVGAARDRVIEGEKSKFMLGTDKFISHDDLQAKLLKNDSLGFRISTILV